jgi:CubicO group peptidase (beta-lactamase class C family)
MTTRSTVSSLRRQRRPWLQATPKTVLSEYLLKDRLARHPGGRYSYSNTGYEILSAIIEEQTGKPYED